MSDSAREVLSEAELDALMKRDTSSSAVEHDEGNALPGEIRNANLASSERIVRGPMATLELVHERFMRRTSIALQRMIREPIVFSLHRISVEAFGNYLETISKPSALEVLDIAPRGLQCLLTLERELVAMLVAAYFGGGRRISDERPAADFSAVEQRIIELVRARLVEELAEAWRPLLPMEFAHARSETNPEFLSFAANSDRVVVVRCRVKLEAISSGMQLILPIELLDPVRELQAGATSEPADLVDGARWREKLRSSLDEARLEGVARLVETELSLGEVLALRAGDILDIELHDEVDFIVEGVPMFRCTVGAHRGRNALKIVRRTDCGT